MVDWYLVENGRRLPGRDAPGDRMVGALGTRAATLEVIGSWEDVGERPAYADAHHGRRARPLHLGALDSDALAEVKYIGHATRDGKPSTWRTS